MFSIRTANEADISQLCALDPVVQRESARRKFIERSVGQAHCLVVTVEPHNDIVGYAVLDYSFYDQGFVSMLYVNPGHRRQGLGTTLMARLESACETRKLFTSTNLSNLPMQSLLGKLGYTLAGTIYHLDEGDPELVYVKYLQGGAA